MGYDIGWIIPQLRNPGRLWSCASSITVAVVGLFSKFIIELMNKTTVYNRAALVRAMYRPPGVPLLTVSNHHSCFDDPGLWGVLPSRVLVSRRRMRWSMAAHDICFTNTLHSAFFALGKCVPVVRGAGVYQPAMDFCIERLRSGEWVHIFPEGRVNVDKEHIRFKWGVGRLVAECARGGQAPLVLPVWHEGLDRVLPNVEPYRLRFRRRLALSVGEPLSLQPLVDSLIACKASEEECRRAITERVQEELMRLRDSTHQRLRLAFPGADGLLDNRTDILVKPPQIENPLSKRNCDEHPLVNVSSQIQSNMKSFIILAVAVACACAYNLTIYDVVNTASVVSKAGQLKSYLDCMIDENLCTPHTEPFKRDFEEMLQTACSECPPSLKHNTRLFLDAVTQDYPQEAQKLLKKYDPEGNLAPALFAAVAGH